MGFNSAFKRLTLSVWPFICQVSAAAGALFNLHAHCGTVVSLLDEKEAFLKGLCPVSLLSFK